VTHVWKGQDVPLGSEGAFKARRDEMKAIVASGTEWLEVHGPTSRRRCHVTMARRMAQVQGIYVLIPWRCWERIDPHTQPIEEVEQRKGRRLREDAGQEKLL
jgi:hypothetical protein